MGVGVGVVYVFLRLLVWLLGTVAGVAAWNGWYGCWCGCLERLERLVRSGRPNPNPNPNPNGVAAWNGWYVQVGPAKSEASRNSIVSTRFA